MRRLLIFAILLAYSLSGCAVGIKRIGYEQPDPLQLAELQKCAIAIKSQTKYNIDDVNILGQVTSYETGLSKDCGELEVLSIFYSDACAQGADLLNIVEEKLPDRWSTCYRAKAELIRYKDRTAASKLETDIRYSPDSLIARAQMEDINFQLRMNEAVRYGILGGIIGGMSVSH